MEYNNYSISNGKGKLYLKSKTPQAGYEEVTYGTDNKVTYHKYENSIKGTLKYFDVKDVEFQGKKLSFFEVSFIDGDTSNKVSVPLKNSKGNYTDEVKAMVSALNAAEVGQEYTLSVTKTTSKGSNGKDYTNLNIYINYVNRLGENGKGLSTGFISFNDIPKPEKEEDEDLGVSWNWKPVNKFYALKIKELKERFESGSTASAPTQAAPQAPTESKPKAETSQPDLPF